MEDILQQGGQITLTALGSLAVLFLLTKLSGNKQVSQMNLFDYVMGITIGSIAKWLRNWNRPCDLFGPWWCMGWRRGASPC